MTHTGWQRTWVRILLTVLTSATMVMIFCLSRENADVSDRRSAVFSGIVIRIVYPEYGQMEQERQQILFDSVQHAIRKCAHFSEYLVLGFLIRLCLESWFGNLVKRKNILALTGYAIGTAYAGSDEAHQKMIEGRSGQWTDVLIDSSGVLAGVALGSVLIRITENRNTGKR